MAKVKEISRVKLIIGVMYKDDSVFDGAVKILTERFGDIEDSIEYDFGFTDYYGDEMGAGLVKRIIIFKDLINRDDLAEIKHWTNGIEDKFSENGSRKINLDPGYLTEHNVVLASAKEMPHKVSIGMGMFGDVVLVYRKGEFMDSYHTFPDYKTGLVKDFLSKIRKEYLKCCRSA